jgi:hypothetical protein
MTPAEQMREAAAQACDNYRPDLTSKSSLVTQGRAMGAAECALRIRALPLPVDPVRDVLVEALRPFAEAAENLPEGARDNADIWESPAAASIDVKHLRAAVAALKLAGEAP